MILVFHPVIITLIMTVITLAMSVKLRRTQTRPFHRNDEMAASPSSFRNLAPASLASPVYRDFERSIVVICFFFTLSQIVNVIFFVFHGLDSPHQYRLLCASVFLSILNSSVNFFIQLMTNKSFRIAARRHLWHPFRAAFDYSRCFSCSFCHGDCGCFVFQTHSADDVVAVDEATQETFIL